MTKLFTRLLAAGAGLVLAAGPASASVTFKLNNVTFASTSASGSPPATLTGSFTTNDALTAVTDYNLVASPDGAGFIGFTYTPTSTTVTASTLPSQFFQLDDPFSLFELRLFFSTGLTTAGGTLAPASSYEHEPGGGNRFLAGSVVNVAATPGAVPEPASWAMLVLGAGAAGYALRRRRAAVRVALAD